MFNVNGAGKTTYGYINSSHKDSGKNVGKSGKKDERKENNTDRAEFSSFMQDKTIGGGLKVGAASANTAKLSQKAQDYLEKLKKKYGNMDFIIEDYSTDEQADKLLAKGKGEYNVLITPDLLERMADDEDTAAEYEAMIDKSVESIEGVREGLGEDRDMVSKYGVSFDANGNMSIRAMLAGDLTASDGSNTVKASTVEEMLESLRKTKEEQSEKLAKLREERAKEAEEKAAEEDKEEELNVDFDDNDGTVVKIIDDRGEAAVRMNSVIAKQKESELSSLLESLNDRSGDTESRRGQHSHFSAKA